MGKINKLDKSVYNRIAAGEVVERPYSVVKELVENAVDAGANAITVDIRNGGKTYMRVTDNGSGIAQSDILTAFLPHATSKIANFEDLENIATLGFRGEALPSIASVADVLMESRESDAESGYFVKLASGEVVSEGVNGMARGTVVTVENLFANIPARAKFLKKDKSEEAEITKLMTDVILANPNISFNYSADGKSVFRSGGRGAEDAVYSVYGRDITNNLVSVSYNRGGFIVRGFIGKPNFTKPTRSYQTTVINGRVVANQVVSTAVTQAYGNNLMRRAFPVYVLEILMPFGKLDVNVTPSKTDVRFVEPREVFGAVFYAVKNALEASADVISLSSDGDNVNPADSDKTETRGNDNTIGRDHKLSRDSQAEISDNALINGNSDISKSVAALTKLPDLNTKNNNDVRQNSSVNTDFNSSSLGFVYESPIKNDSNTRGEFNNYAADVSVKTSANVASTDNLTNLSAKSGNFKPTIGETENTKSITGEKFDNKSSVCPGASVNAAEKSDIKSGNSQQSDNGIKQLTEEIAKLSAASFNSTPITALRDSAESAMPQQQSFIDKAEFVINDNFRVLGQVFDTYLLLSVKDFLYIIDQHAAHERMLYDKLCREIDSNFISSQILLAPEIITLPAKDANFLLEIIDALQAIGIDIEEFGANSFKITAIPAIFNGFKFKNFIDELLDDRRAYQQIKLKDILRDRLAITACKAAIKAGDRLNDAEIRMLIGMMKDGLPLQCPHGRPAIIRLERKDIDKIFKRIL